MASTRDRSQRAQQFRTDMKAGWSASNAPCGICGQATIDWDGPPFRPDSFELDHIKSIRHHPEYEFDPSNVQPAHHSCNRAKGAGDTLTLVGRTSEPW